MKASEIRELSEDEKQRKLEDLREESFNLRFQLESKVETDQTRNCAT